MRIFLICSGIAFALSFFTTTMGFWWPDPEPRMGSYCERHGGILLATYFGLFTIPITGICFMLALILYYYP